MLIGLAGAHRSGKTTLAREFAKRNPAVTFAETSVSSIMLSRGFDPARDYPIAERIGIQNIILGELDAHFGKYHNNAIFDRTPLDAAAYLLADVQRENVDPELQKEIVRYVERAMEVTMRRFSVLVFIPSTLPLVDEPGKATATPAYVEHISQLINGLRFDERLHMRHFSLARGHTDLDVRCKAIETVYNSMMGMHMEQSEHATANGALFH